MKPYIFLKNHFSLFSLFAVAILLLLASVFINNFFSKNQDENKIVNKFESRLDVQIEELKIQLNRYASSILSQKTGKESTENKEKFNELFQQEGFVFLAFKNNKLSDYSDNHLPQLSYDSLVKFQPTKILALQNGWYFPVYHKEKGYVFIGFHLIKNNFVFQNKYLQNNFSACYELPENSDLSSDYRKGSLEIKSRNLQQSFYLFLGTEPENNVANNLVAFLFCLGFLLLVYSIFDFVNVKLTRLQFLPLVLIYTIIILTVRWLSLQINWFGYLSQSKIFDPSLYASSAYFPSLGDLLINSILFCFLGRFFNKSLLAYKNSKSIFVVGSAIFMLLFTFVYAWLINELIKSLVESSRINFNITNLFEVTTFGVIGFFALGLLFWAFYQFASISVVLIKRIKNSFSLGFLLVIATGLVFLIPNTQDLVLFSWPIGILLLALTIEFYKNKLSILINTIAILIVFSFVAGFFINKYSNSKEKSEQLILAEKLSVNDDPVTEFLFSKIENQILEDDSLSKLLSDEEKYTSQDIEGFLSKKYLSGYWNKYKINSHVFSVTGAPWGKQPYQKPKTIEELDTIISNYGTKVNATESLYHIYNKGNLLSYIVKLPLAKINVDSTKFFIFIEFTSKILNAGIGFPELLIDSDPTMYNYLSKYSTARYIGGMLVNKEGEYPYGLLAGVFEEQRENISTSIINGYEHLIYRVDKNTFVIVSKKIASFYEQFTKYSYFFVFFGMVFMLGSLLSRLGAGKSVWSFGLSYKIQSTLILFGVTSLLVFGFAIRYIIIKQNEIKNQKQVSEKTQSILIELKEKLDAEEQLNFYLSDYLDGLLSDWSQIFFTDINLFDLSGNLISTSQPRIYKEGLLAAKMNPIAFNQLYDQYKSEFFQNENLGNLKYLSSYMPLRNNLNHVIGFVNLPYFARQNELEQELSQFLVAIINVFFLLIILSILAALFVTEWITKPLVFIKEGLVNIDLNKTNQQIIYKQNDEVGELVAAYNLKVAELQLKAEQLAKSEREGAWKEMAKQVAHEIKKDRKSTRLNSSHVD